MDALAQCYPYDVIPVDTSWVNTKRDSSSSCCSIRSRGHWRSWVYGAPVVACTWCVRPKKTKYENIKKMGVLVWTTCGPQRIQEANNFARVCASKQYCLLRSNYTVDFVILLYTDHANIVPGSVDKAELPNSAKPIHTELWRKNLCLVSVPGKGYCFPCIPTLLFRFQKNHLVDMDTDTTIISIQVNTSGTVPFLKSESIEFTGIHTGAGGRQIVCATYPVTGTALASCLQSVGLACV